MIELEWGADTERFTPGAAGRVPFTKEPGAIVAVFAGAFRAWHGAIQLVDAVRQLHERGLDAFRAVFLGDGPERPAAMAAAAGDPRFVFAGAVSHDDMPAALAAADIGVAPFDVARHPPLALGFYWSPLKVFEYMASGLPVVAPALPRLRDLVGDAVEGLLYEPATSDSARRRAGHARRSRTPRATGRRRPRTGRSRLQLGGALPRPRPGVSRAALTRHYVRILLVTDSFPPNCGGSGWSTYELARGLRERGHEISIVRPRPGHPPHGTGSYDGFDVDEIGATAPGVPFIRNYFKNERLWRQLEHALVDRIRAHRIDIVHGQHVLSSLPAIAAGHTTRIPSVATVRDYWPLCYWADLILDPDATALCPSCTAGHMTRCLRPHAGALWPLTLPAIPYMRANLTREATRAGRRQRGDRRQLDDRG